MTNLRVLLHSWLTLGKRYLQVWGGAIAFYTCIPIPHTWTLEFAGIARWAPLVGLLMGASLGLLDGVLLGLGLPLLVRSAVVVTAWLGITGGLHLDGAMDAADGLAVLDPQRRLDVMADSRSGAFGVMAAVVILLLKTTALTSLGSDRTFALMVAAGWGRWGQLVAIVRYPYLKPAGKGAFHKAAIHSTWDVMPSLIALIGVSSCFLWLQQTQWWVVVLIDSMGCFTAIITGAWFDHKLGGHTGDTYGAVVEWTEALLLCGMTMFSTLGK